MSKKNKSWSVKSIWLFTLVPLVIAWTMAYTGIGLPTGTNNNGTLMPAGMIVPNDLVNHQDGKWGMVVVSDRCDDVCQQQVYRLQQLFISLAKHEERLHAVWVSNDSAIKTADLSVELNFDRVHLLHNKTVFNWFEQNELAWQDHSIWLVDPNGILVLRFNPELSGRQMMSDIKWLLKASRVG